MQQQQRGGGGVSGAWGSRVCRVCASKAASNSQGGAALEEMAYGKQDTYLHNKATQQSAMCQTKA
jgi:hypothetical protein